MESSDLRIPVILLTGFLGSGKTTLLKQAMQGSDGAGTLVLVNEIGEVGLDHDLLWQGGEVPLVLDNGCVCCSVGDDLLTSLEDLFWARLHRRIPRFERIVIETTGLADPRPVISALRDRVLVAQRFRYGGTITVVDATAGGQAAANEEAFAQIAVADRIILSKTDIATNGLRLAALDRVCEINPLAAVEEGAKGTGALPGLFLVDLPGASWQVAGIAHTHGKTNGHAATTFTLPLARLQSSDAVEAALSRLALLAPRLMRAKGVVKMADGHSFVLHVVGQTASPPERFLGRPEAKAMDKLVVIGKGLDQDEVRVALGPLAG